MDVSKNRGTPKSSILIGFSIINHPFWGTLIFGNTQIDLICNYPDPKSNIDTKNDGLLTVSPFKYGFILGIHVSFSGVYIIWAIYSDLSRGVVTPNGSLVREGPPKIPETFRFRNYTNLPRYYIT